MILWLAILVLGLLVKAVIVLTPGDHVAKGCWWWTSPTVTDIAGGYEGCLRGYVVKAGGLTESRDESSYALSFDPGETQCVFVPGQAVVVRGRAIFADGRTYTLIHDCG